MKPSAAVEQVAHSARSEPPSATLHRALGLVEVTAGGVGIIIGAGIYVLLGAATAQAGAAVWMAFVLAALLSALTGLSYAELASMFPSAAAEYEYTRHAFAEWIAFVVGWTMITGLVVAAAAVSLGFARYLGHFVEIDPRGAAVSLLVFVSLVAGIGIKHSARLTLALSAVQIGGLLIVIAIGLPHVGDVNLLEGADVRGVLSAAALVFFAFIGFDEVITLAEETRDPTRIVPRALLLALGLSTALYIAVAIAAVSVVGADLLSRSPRPLADVMAHDLGGASVSVVAAIALLSTMNTTLLAITAASRLTYGMAMQRAMPRLLALVHRGRRTPLYAIFAVGLAAVAFAVVGELALIAAVTDFAVYVVFVAVNGAVIALRVRRPEMARPFAVPGAIAGIPVIPVLGLVAVVTMAAHLETRALAIGAALVGIGALAAWRSRANARLTAERATADAGC